MIKKLVLGLMVLGFVGTVSAADLFTGTWKLNVAKSKFTAGMEVKALSVVIVEKGANLAISATGTDGAGKASSVKYTVPTQGGAVSYTEGAPASGATAVTKRVDASTIDGTSSLNGKEIGTTHATVSADGRTLTRVVKGMDANGKAFTNTEVYERQ
jgi:polyphosphate kinase 2 (PPK2 family)